MEQVMSEKGQVMSDQRINASNSEGHRHCREPIVWRIHHRTEPWFSHPAGSEPVVTETALAVEGSTILGPIPDAYPEPVDLTPGGQDRFPCRIGEGPDAKRHQR